MACKPEKIILLQSVCERKMAETENPPKSS